MKDIKLLRAIGGVDDALLVEYEQDAGITQKSAHKTWARLGAMAACLCLVVVAALSLPGLLHGPAQPGPQPGGVTAPGGDPGGIIPPGSNPGTPDNTAPVKQPEVHYNMVSSRLSADAAPRAGFAIFSELLDEAGIEAAAPGMRLPWMELTGSAGFYGWGELAAVWVNISNAAWGDNVTVALTYTDKPIYSGMEYTLEEGEPVATVIDGMEFYVYLYEYEDMVYLTAESERDGVAYSLSIDAAAADADAAKADLYDVMSCYAAATSAPDLESITAKHSDEWLNETYTESDAHNDADFGAYLPTERPHGFTEETFRRFRGNGEDYLYGSWSYGYEHLSWKASRFTEADGARLTSAVDTENYDLALYPIPRADSVPDELREIVDNPIFDISELTPEVVSARAYTVQDAGDTDGYRMRFSVRYGDVVVEISSKGVSPEWVCEQLVNIGQ